MDKPTLDRKSLCGTGVEGISEDPLNYRGGEVCENGLEWGEEIHSAYACKA